MKKVKILTIILLVVLITMIGAFGIYFKVQNRMENKLKEYAYSMDLNGCRNVRLKVNTESKDVIKDSEGKEVETEEELTDDQLAEKGYTKESVPNNSQDVLNLDNYEKAKKIIEDRLKEQNVEEYEVALNDETGEITVQIPENSNTDSIVSNLNTVGKFEILDSETKEVLMDNNDIKKAQVMYGASSSTGSGTSVYLSIQFTKDGAKKLEEISTNYTKKEDSDANTTSEENTTNTQTEENTTNSTENTTNTTEDTSATSEEEKTEKQITMKIDDEEIMTTSFDEPIRTGTLQLTVGSSSTDADTLQGYMKNASSMASILTCGNMPVQYDVEQNEYILSDLGTEFLQYIKLAIVILMAIGIIILVIKYRANGLLAGLTMAGFAGLYTILLKYTNVTLSLQGIAGIIISLVLNYILINILLSKIKNGEGKTKKEKVNKAIADSYKEFFIKIIPICIMAVVFALINWMPISSFGMTMFWGIVLIAVYDFVITSTILKIKEVQ